MCSTPHTSRPAVLMVGIDRGPFALEGSWFRGREPDENRYDLDTGRPDSWSTRLWFRPGREWTIQGSHGFLHEPEQLEPGDQRRTNASISWFRQGQNFTAVTAAVGRNVRPFSTVRALLLELTRQFGRTFCVRPIRRSDCRDRDPAVPPNRASPAPRRAGRPDPDVDRRSRPRRRECSRIQRRSRRRCVCLPRPRTPAIHAWTASCVISPVRPCASAVSRWSHVEHDDGPADDRARRRERARRHDSRSSIAGAIAGVCAIRQKGIRVLRCQLVCQSASGGRNESGPYCLRSEMVTDCGSPPAHAPVKPGLVHLMVSVPTSPRRSRSRRIYRDHRRAARLRPTGKRRHAGEAADGANPFRRLGFPGPVHASAALEGENRDGARRKIGRLERTDPGCRPHSPGRRVSGWWDLVPATDSASWV